MLQRRMNLVIDAVLSVRRYYQCCPKKIVGWTWILQMSVLRSQHQHHHNLPPTRDSVAMEVKEWVLVDFMVIRMLPL